MSDRATIAASETDFLVIGGGLAGLYASLRAARHGTVTLVSKSPLQVSSSAWAQGGVAAAISADDSPELHAKDTLEAGRGLCNSVAVEVLTRQGPECIEELAALGVPFVRDFEQGKEGFDLTQEGGHSRRRILHTAGGATGEAIIRVLSQRVRESPRIRLSEDAAVTDLVSDHERCYGALAAEAESGAPLHFRAPYVILATGGVAGLYRLTTNPPTSTGDGMALAYRAGAELMDMEFVQFHPTALYSSNGNSFLISEATRGEGAWLLNAAGRRFLLDHDERGELAPRDVVALAIHQEMKKTGAECVWLSMKHLKPAWVRERFSYIYNGCMERGLDLTADLIPVSPAAHYMIGGVRTDSRGRTNLEGLWACGETASTGVHGANRLASNSLLECLVFAKRAVEDALTSAFRPGPRPVPGPAPRWTCESHERDAQRLAALMTDSVGLVRSEAGLKAALAELENLWKLSAGEALGWRNRLTVARLMAQAALLRRESRGVHRREDFASPDDAWRKHIVFHKDREPAFIPV